MFLWVQTSLCQSNVKGACSIVGVMVPTVDATADSPFLLPKKSEYFWYNQSNCPGLHQARLIVSSETESQARTTFWMIAFCFWTAVDVGIVGKCSLRGRCASSVSIESSAARADSRSFLLKGTSRGCRTVVALVTSGISSGPSTANPFIDSLEIET